MRTLLLIHHAPEQGNGFIRSLVDFISVIIKLLRIPLITVSNASKNAIEGNTPLKGFKVIYNDLEVKEGVYNVQILSKEDGR